MLIKGILLIFWELLVTREFFLPLGIRDRRHVAQRLPVYLIKIQSGTTTSMNKQEKLEKLSKSELTMDKPERVRRVVPPSTTIPNTMAQQANSQ